MRPDKIEQKNPNQESVWDYPRPPRVEASQKYIQVIFNGVTIADHIPVMAGGPRVSTAYTIGYMKALLRRANEETELQ